MQSDMDEFLDLVGGQDDEKEEVKTLHEYVEMDIHKFADMFPDAVYLKIGDDYEEGVKIVDIEEVSIFIDMFQICYRVDCEGNDYRYYEETGLDEAKVLALLNDETIESMGGSELFEWLDQMTKALEAAKLGEMTSAEIFDAYGLLIIDQNNISDSDDEFLAKFGINIDELGTA
jgi:hypothetical protein